MPFQTWNTARDKSLGFDIPTKQTIPERRMDGPRFLGLQRKIIKRGRKYLDPPRVKATPIKKKKKIATRREKTILPPIYDSGSLSL